MQDKTKKKYIIGIFKLVFFILLFSFVLALPVQILAADVATDREKCPPKDSVRLQVHLPMDGVEICDLKGPIVRDGIIQEGTKKVYYIKDIQTYVKGIFTLSIGVLALGAIVVIMLGGFEYVWAAGNTQRISSAKSMISGALGGLALALLSYGLLNTINPEIVSLRITKVDPIRKIERVLYCKDVPKPKSPLSDLIFAELPKNNTNPEDLNYNLNASGTMCGNLYYIKAGAGNTCFGRECEKAQGNEIQKKCINGTCQEATIYGKYDFAAGKYIDNDLDLWAVCGNKALFSLIESYKTFEVLPTDIEDYMNSGDYSVAGQRRPLPECNDSSKPPKYFFLVEVNDDGGSDDDWVLVPSGGVCDRPIVMCEVDGEQTVATFVNGGYVCTGTLVTTPMLMDLEVLYLNTTRPLWTHQQIKDGNNKCDINITDDLFPEDFEVQTYECTGGAAIHTHNGMVEGQYDDATPDLTELIEALDTRITWNLNSISDDGLFVGGGDECRAWLPEGPNPTPTHEKYNSDPNCIHMETSKHYGGVEFGDLRVKPVPTVPPSTRTHSEGFSCAIDIGETATWPYACIEQELIKLKSEGVPISNSYGGKGFLNEGDHIHVEVWGCGRPAP